MKIVIVVQARMGSTRLPGKVMHSLAGRTVLSRVIERCRAMALADEVVIATTVLQRDDVIVEEAEAAGVPWFRGSEEDVLSRYYGAAKEYGADIVVRITSDCPIIDPGISTQVIQTLLDTRVDYCSNIGTRTYPQGLDTEAFTFESLERAYRHATDLFEREHVTPYLYRNPDLFAIHNVTNITDESRYRWTLDTSDDLRLLSLIYEKLHRAGHIFTFAEVLALMKREPELAYINTPRPKAAADGGSLSGL